MDLRPSQVGRVFNEGLWKLGMNIFLDKQGRLPEKSLEVLCQAFLDLRMNFTE